MSNLFNFKYNLYSVQNCTEYNLQSVYDLKCRLGAIDLLLKKKLFNKMTTTVILLNSFLNKTKKFKLKLTYGVPLLPKM